MRNRVSFSYVGDYNTVYDAYSYTVFIAYSDNDIWRNGIKYTYLKDNVGSYVVHNFGTSYIRQESKNHIAYLYENEYDRYKYEITEDQSKNNEKSILSSNENDVYNESLHTYIYANSSEYTYFPSFIEGFTGENYEYNKIAYSYATNNMPIDTDTFSAEDNDYGFSIGDLTTNIRGTYNESADKIYKIIGVGFSDENISSNMMINNDYNHIINAYIYGSYIENNQVHIGRIINSDLYNSLNITMPGITTGYEVVHTDECAYLNINESMRNIGNVLIKLDLNWKNNNYVLYKKLEFSHETNNIGKIETIDFFVNNRSNPRRQFLEGDNINKLRIMTNPQTAAGTVWAYINNSDSNISAYYIGQTHKEYNTPEYRQYSFDNSYYVTGFENNNDKIETEFTYIYNNSNNNFEAHQKVNYPVYKLEATDINISYKIGSNPEVSFNNVDIYNGNNAVNVSGNFKISPQYSYQLHPDSSYNIVKVSYEYSNGVDNNQETPYKLNGLSFVDNKNTYSFKFHNIDEPGKYEFKFLLKNGLCISNDIIGTLISYNKDDSVFDIITYEGAFNEPFLPNELKDSYILNTDCINRYTLNANESHDIYFPTSSTNFNNWEDTCAYIDIIQSSFNGNIGFVCQNIDPLDVDKNSIVNYTDLQYMMDYFCFGITNNQNNPIYNWSNEKRQEFRKIADINHDEIFDISDINLIINYILTKPLFQISKPDSNFYDELSLNFYKNENKYKLLNESYDIKVKKIGSKLKIKKSNGTFIYSGDDLFFNENKINNVINTFGSKTNPEIYIDLSKYQDNEVTIEGYETTYINVIDKTNNNQIDEFGQKYNDTARDLILNNFKVSIDENSVSCVNSNDEPLSNDSIVHLITSENNYDKISLTFNKTNLNISGDDYVKVSWQSKLDRKSVDGYNIDYWDAMGFKNATRINTCYIYNTMQMIDDITVPSNIYLFTNVKNLNDINDTSWYSHQYITAQPGQNIETFTIKYNGNDWTNQNNLNINQENGVIIFKPDHYENEINTNISLTLQTRGGRSKNITVHLLPLSFEYNESNIKSKKYIKDISSNKLLFEEILLSNTTNGAGNNMNRFSNDNTFIEKFCNESIEVSLLDYYEIESNASIKFKLKNYASNIPDGVEFSFNNTNLIFNYAERVLIPTNTNEFTINLEYVFDSNINHNTSISLESTDIEEITIPQEKIYTNGQKKS